MAMLHDFPLVPPAQGGRTGGGGRGDDRGSIVIGWLSRIVLVAAFVAIVGFEVLSIMVTKVQIQDIGQTAAQKALDQYAATKDVEASYQAASAYAEGEGSRIPAKTFKIDASSVSFRLEKTATTLFLYRWDKTAGLARVSTSVYAEPLAAGGQIP